MAETYVPQRYGLLSENTRVSNREPSLFNDTGRYLDSFGNTPNISFGNAVQGATRLLPPGISQAASGILGLFGVGTNDTGNPLTNKFLQPTFGIGTNNLSHIPANSSVWNDPGATALPLSIFDEPAQPQSLFNSRTLAPRNIQPDMSAAEKSLYEAYSNPSYYDQAGGGWKSGTGEGVPTAQTGYRGDIQPAQSGGSQPWSPWYSGQPNPFDLTGNLADSFMLGADFGGGRFTGGSGLSPDLWGSWGPLARFSSDPNGTD